MNNRLREASRRLHLWIGLLSGFAIHIIHSTIVVYILKDEITAISEPWRFVETQNKSTIQPSTVLKVATDEVGGKPTAITYGEHTDAIFVDYYDRETTVVINPYDGQIIKQSKKGKTSSIFSVLSLPDIAIYGYLLR